MKLRFYYEIYSLRESGVDRRLQFANSRDLVAFGLKVKPDNYEQVYASIAEIEADGDIEDQDVLDEIFNRFANTETRPGDFFGHAVSTSDIVRLFPLFGKATDAQAYYTDAGAGWIRLSTVLMQRLPMADTQTTHRTMKRIAEILG